MSKNLAVDFVSKLRRNPDMTYSRSMEAKIRASPKSLLLLGPRQVGKSTLIRNLKPDLTVNFARESTFLEFSSQPNLLEKILKQDRPRSVFIDEVQRIPSLLNTIQAIIDETPTKYRFFLTGSSARKLRRGNANLLPGRLVTYQMGPLTYRELGKDFDLQQALVFGTLPGIWSEPNPKIKKELLRSYASTYLKEEIQAEALTKNIEGFSRFLFVASSKSGEFLDYSKMGSLASITRKTSSRFFEILEDTLIVRRLDSFAKSTTRRLIQHPKFYFFDGGVLNGLLGGFSAPEDRQGFLFEHFIINQILIMNALEGDSARLSTYRTEAGSEVDLIFEIGSDLVSLEIKYTKTVHPKDLLGLKRFAEFYGKKHQSILMYNGTRAYRDDFIEVLPWRQALDRIENLLSSS